MTEAERFRNWFHQATLHSPYHYQARLALDEPMPSLLHVPTGLGKTAAAILAWLWRRREAPPEVRAQTPRRLVYCLPMRVLVEQTRDNTVLWLRRLDRLGGAAQVVGSGAEERVRDYMPSWSDPNRIAVSVLMGGEDDGEWDLYPERDAILIGTQDMLLSRALNRGYAMSRYRWPMHFGLLNNDCLWVLDEVQLMGPGLVTACQLEAFRGFEVGGSKYFGCEPGDRSLTLYVSATAGRRLLVSREWRKDDGDHRPPNEQFVLELSDQEKADRSGPLGQRRLATKKLIVRSDQHFDDDQISAEILKRHDDMMAAVGDAEGLPRRTLVICNTVSKARALADSLRQGAAADIMLLHSRFRRPDRDALMKRLEGNPSAQAGQIVVATQVIEAGVDISSAMLWTEAAPLPSIVQRLGRLNRDGKFGHEGRTTTRWIPSAVVLGIAEIPEPRREAKEARGKRLRENAQRYLPYDAEECRHAMDVLAAVSDASPANLEVALAEPLAAALKSPTGAIQRHELLDLFDTEANLSLGYTDVSPFVRGLDPETDVQVLWRDWGGSAPPFSGDIGSDELCSVPIWQFRKLRTRWKGFIWQGRERGWQPTSERNLFPGATILLPISSGGYSTTQGWTGNESDSAIASLYSPPMLPSDADLLSVIEGSWESIACHTLRARQALAMTLVKLDVKPADPLHDAMLEAILWHDFGKNHPEWQAAVEEAAQSAEVEPESCARPYAKFSFSNSPRLRGLTGRKLQAEVYRLKNLFRPGLRHEVAGALALRQSHRRGNPTVGNFPLLSEYLVMSHHGYVRKVLRNELPKSPRANNPVQDEVRGIAEGAKLDPVNIDGQTLSAGPLSIECRQVGRCSDGSESWTRGVLRVLEHFGPFRLAYYEAVFRAADWRASKSDAG